MKDGNKKVQNFMFDKVDKMEDEIIHLNESLDEFEEEFEGTLDSILILKEDIEEIKNDCSDMFKDISSLEFSVNNIDEGVEAQFDRLTSKIEDYKRFNIGMMFVFGFMFLGCILTLLFT